MKGFDFRDKRILLTGVGGIGEAVVKQLCECGASIVIMDIDSGKMDILKEKMPGVTATYMVNFSDIGQLSGVVQAMVKEQCPFDGFVFCTGITGSRPFKDSNYESIGRVMNINFFSFVEILRIVTKRGNFNKGFNAVAISSVGAILGNPGQTAYCASKAAMNGAVRAIAKELAPKGIRVNTIAPGTVETSMFKEARESFGDATAFNARLERQYLGLCLPTDIADMVCFLMSDLSRMITGQCIPVDGGKLTS